MRIFVTGGAGFVGGAVVRQVRARGDEVVAAVRDPERASGLAALGCRVVRSDLSSTAELAGLMAGVDGVIHAAGSYRLGLAARERPAMEESNVGATTRVLDAAIAAGASRIVYVSTIGVYGDTHGMVVDETYRRDLSAGFLSWYDDTKYRAHRIAEDRIAAGAPIVIGLPGQVYGPGDHSQAGAVMRDAFRGRLRYVALVDAGSAPVYVDDLATGLLACLDRGRVGQAYDLGGDPVRFLVCLETAARLGGRRLPRLTIPASTLRRLAPLSGPFGDRFGIPANIAEVVTATDGVTYWASNDKATRELGFVPRPLADGLGATYLPGLATGSSVTAGSGTDAGGAP